MKIRNGNMLLTKTITEHLKDSNKPLVILITTNGDIKKDGSLVMGRGAAFDASKKMPDLPKLLGDRVRTLNVLDYAQDGKVYWEYGVVVIGQPKLYNAYYGAFQVKDHWYNQARPDLIEFSVGCLLDRIQNDKVECDYWLNYPGVGNGRLDESTVFPLIERLPDNVTVWKL